jgi:hypothetical protein
MASSTRSVSISKSVPSFGTVFPSGVRSVSIACILSTWPFDPEKPLTATEKPRSPPSSWAG